MSGGGWVLVAIAILVFFAARFFWRATKELWLRHSHIGEPEKKKDVMMPRYLDENVLFTVYRLIQRMPAGRSGN